MDNMYSLGDLVMLVSDDCGINQKARFEMTMLTNSGMMAVIIPINWFEF
jgi:hypothetical protein